jgi:methionine-rich copper-binding protein CopC
MSRGRRRPVGRTAIGALLATFAMLGLVAASVLLAAPTASAHDVLESTSPADNSTVAVVPAQVVLTFDLPAFATGTQILVKGPSGNVASGAPRLVNHLVMQTVAGGSPAGHYTVLWRVTSADGHPVSGQFAFTARAASAKTAANTSAATRPAASAKTSAGGRSPWWLLLGLLLLPIGLVVRGSRRGRRASGSSG